MRFLCMLCLTAACAATQPPPSSPAGAASSEDTFRKSWREAAEDEWNVRKTFSHISEVPPDEKRLFLDQAIAKADSLASRLKALKGPSSLASCHAEAIDGSARLAFALSKIRTTWNAPSNSATQSAQSAAVALDDLRRARRSCGVSSADPDGLDSE